MARWTAELDGRRARVDGAWVGCLAAVALFVAVAGAPAFATTESLAASDKLPKLSKQFRGKLPITELTEEEATLHALNRLGYGPRPGDVERVRKMGLEKWVEQQLAPEKIDDAAVQARLEKYTTLAMSPEKLLQEFPPPQVAARRAGMTPEEYIRQQQARAKQREEFVRRREMGEMPGEEPAGNRRQNLQNGDPNMAPRLEEVRAPARIIAELSMAKMTRAIHSERQLNEQLVDFWFNHFNVFAQKGADRYLVTSYENDTIRPNAWGKFRDLLGATAKSPAMLFYLDNWQSADPKAFERMEKELQERRGRILQRFGGGSLDRMRRERGGQLGQRRPGQNPDQQQRPPQLRQRRGLNENYARELMELHTLGVDGGYTQQDVVEVARAFTGWTLEAPRRSADFRFEERIHDPNPKSVLGTKIDAGGMRDGEMILELLARHPNTAKFIATKLARRFVSDAPPQALIGRMAKKFQDTDGDIRGVVREMIYSPEFWSRAAYRAKIKKPFELVASTARALDAQIDVPLGLVMWTGRIGEPLYLCQPPTGYSDKAEAWVNTGALLNRLNFALALAGNRMRGSRVNTEQLFGIAGSQDAQKALARAVELFLAGEVTPETRATLEKQLTDPKVLQATLDDRVQNLDAGVIAGLVLGSPEFQRR